jgi:hypothetical protein
MDQKPWSSVNQNTIPHMVFPYECVIQTEMMIPCMEIHNFISKETVLIVRIEILEKLHI